MPSDSPRELVGCPSRDRAIARSPLLCHGSITRSPIAHGAPGRSVRVRRASLRRGIGDPVRDPGPGRTPILDREMHGACRTRTAHWRTGAGRTDPYFFLYDASVSTTSRVTRAWRQGDPWTVSDASELYEIVRWGKVVQQAGAAGIE